MSKENLQIKAIRYFYDIPGTIDEYAYQELSHFGNNMYMLFITTILGSLLLSLLTNTDIMGIALTVVFFYAIYKQGKLVNKLGIDKIEIEASELKATQGKMLKRSLLETLIVTLLGLSLWFYIWIYIIPDDALVHTNFYLVISTLIMTVLLAGFNFIIFSIANRKKIIIVED